MDECGWKQNPLLYIFSFWYFLFIFQELRTETVRGHNGTEQGILGNYIFPLGMEFCRFLYLLEDRKGAKTILNWRKKYFFVCLNQGVIYKKKCWGIIIALNLFPPIYPHDDHRFLEYPGDVSVHRMCLLCFLMGSHLHWLLRTVWRACPVIDTGQMQVSKCTVYMK